MTAAGIVPARPRRPAARWPRGWLGRMIGVARSRSALAALDDAQLRDVGISRAEAATESRRAPWDAGAFRCRFPACQPC